jgi:hypothetical protein
MDEEEFKQMYLDRFDNDEYSMIGDIGAIEKLSLERAFRENGLSENHATTMCGVWSNVVHLKCQYTPKIYCMLRDALRVLPEGSFRDSMRTRFLVALGVKDFPSLPDS